MADDTRKNFFLGIVEVFFYQGGEIYIPSRFNYSRYGRKNPMRYLSFWQDHF